MVLRNDFHRFISYYDRGSVGEICEKKKGEQKGPKWDNKTYNNGSNIQHEQS